MLRNLLLVASIILISTTSILAGDLVEFSLTPEFGFYSGETEYSLRVEYSFIDESNTTVDAAIASRLQFPLDTKLGGIGLKLNSGIDKTRWSIKLTYQKSLSDPSDKMKDSDGDKMLPYHDETLFSYTESDVEMSMYIFRADLTYRMLQFDNVSFSFALGLRYQKISQDIIGYDGYQLQPLPDFTFGDPFYFSGDEDAINYELKLKQPYAGLHTDIALGEALKLSLKTLYATTFFEDLDDHLLRYKLSTADGDGKGFIGNFSLDWNIPTAGMVKPFLGLTCELTTYDASGSQMQEWYEDEGYIDPNTNEFVVQVEKGTTIAGIPHKIKGTQYHIGFNAGLRF